jgi:MoxR-like ATPase
MKQSGSPQRVAAIKEAADRMRASICRVIVGKEDVIDLVLVALLCEGHILIDDVPGIGKTTLAKAVAKSLGCSFKRIQFTPDLLPSDITGVNFFNQKKGEFEFRPGPISAQIVLADEINRATPRTQSALLEAMQERQITVDGETIPLPSPFMVIATQNPIELEGTFPLPEAQVDRFMLRIKLGYPSKSEEERILLRFERDDPLVSLEAVLSAEELLQLKSLTETVSFEDSLRGYVVNIAQATRSHPAIELGASPRAALALYKTARAFAAINGRDYVIPDDVKYLAPHVLAHRLVLSSQVRLRGRSSQDVVAEILTSVAVPIEA